TRACSCASTRSRCRAVSRASSSCARAAAMPRSQLRMLWRCTSVGCAVRTGTTSARANHAQRLVPAERVEQRFQPAAHRLRLGAFGAAETHRLLADALDALEAVGAGLVAQDLAE